MQKITTIKQSNLKYKLTPNTIKLKLTTPKAAKIGVHTAAFNLRLIYFYSYLRSFIKTPKLEFHTFLDDSQNMPLPIQIILTS
jgi:hypothetical protein